MAVTSIGKVRTMWFLHILHFYYRVMYCMGLVIGGLSENISALFLYKVNGVNYSLIYGYGLRGSGEDVGVEYYLLAVPVKMLISCPDPTHEGRGSGYTSPISWKC